MITARNYAAQAERGLQNWATELVVKGRNNDAKQVGGVIKVINDAVKFAVPDGGRILDDELKGINGEELRLPFPVITVEYFTRNENVVDQLNRNLLVAVDDGEGIAVVSILMLGDVVVPHPSIAYVDMCNAYSCKNKPFTAIESKVSKVGGMVIEMKVVPLYPSQQGRSMAGEDNGICASNVRVLYELLEALSCSNVTHEPLEKINPAVNARRIRDGKLPLYETRCLVINAGKSVAAGDGIGGTHGSPRQHLRRGHIRRHPTAGNIWVNSCVVGSADIGVIEKQYAVM